ERDGETGLDYFGARYFSGAQGRFTSTDPSFLNILKVVNPQRWNLYGYAVNNPLKFVDPDGNEAIAVLYPGYQVGISRSFTLPLGHAGVVMVAKGGSTHYFEYGRYAPSGAGGDVAQGIVRNAGPANTPTPAVQRDASGKITAESMKALLGTLSSAAGKNGVVEATVFDTNEIQDAAMEAYLEGRQRQNSTSSRRHYRLFGGYNCGTLICEALDAAGRRSPAARTMQTPANIFSKFMAWPSLFGVSQTFVYVPPKEKVMSKICYQDENGKTVCQ
ncbi:MAG: RHS repeat-associated core domain-containing protein, partial [Bryobacterales bacterium]|nr:RHS repeat-associated core domain-containing protein [Bryobacterales bacterium]